MSPENNPYKVLSQFTIATIRFVIVSVGLMVLVGGPVYYQFLGKAIPFMPNWNTLAHKGTHICVIEIRTHRGALFPRQEAFDRKAVPFQRLIEDTEVARQQAASLARLYPMHAPLFLYVAQPDSQGNWKQIIQGEAFHAP